MRTRPVERRQGVTSWHAIAVDEAHRGDGHGSALLSFVETRADGHGCDCVALAVRDVTDDARRFYESNGLSEWGVAFETDR
ncbi:GNAT family N-acetyltransferase [Haloprofundus halobius]|uniref:GNAT family N-acetyltransferase n=1 Tax=Haloprofundus halobius TaxID=2876194 RepID=UPI001CCE1311|nr:GNAT family N-acetyltransferase [Haloprofundus halobius]